MPIIGTAGHVDHGKSTLVEALTGRDPDRWDEEKRRGLTIDLGFAWAMIDGVEVGFVDVPGHERFIKNMLAGVVAVDCTLLVIAADSGWMPQTEEHVRVLDILEAEQGVIALTRADLVDKDTIELATLEISEEVAGTKLADWPIVPVSAITGDGLDELRKALTAAISSGRGEPGSGFRMWVDRVFTVHGSGLVVTGTVQRGSADSGEDVEILPSGVVARVRGLHHHDTNVDTVYAGQRAALNITGIAPSDISRGSLVADPGTATGTARFAMTVRTGRGFDAIPDRGAFHIHTGTADRPVTIRKVTESEVIVTTTDPVPAVIGDRVIIRESGRQAVVGGGRIIDPSPELRTDKGAIRDLGMLLSEAPTPDARADVLLRVYGSIGVEDIRRRTSGGLPTAGITVGSIAVSADLVDRLAAEAVPLVDQYHREYPKRAGIPSAELASRLKTERDVIGHIVEYSDGLVSEDGFIRSVVFVGELTPADTERWDAVRSELEASFDVPRASNLGMDEELLHALIRRGELVRIDGDLVFTAGQVAELTERIIELEDGFTVSAFKDHFGMARRQAVPMLEWFDKRGVTRRHGEGRLVRGRKEPG